MGRIRVFYCESFKTAKKKMRTLTHYSQGQFQEIIGKILVKHFAIESAHQPHRRKSKSKEFRESNTYFFSLAFFFRCHRHSVREHGTEGGRESERNRKKRNKKLTTTLQKKGKPERTHQRHWLSTTLQ